MSLVPYVKAIASPKVVVRRIALVVSIVFCGSLAMAAAVVAAGGGGGLAPGVYRFTNTDATATFGIPKGSPPGQQGFSVIVDRGLNSFRPRDPNGPRTVMKNTIISLSLFDSAGTVTFGCFIINPSDFTVSGDLQTARVHTTLTAAEVCPGFGAPVTSQASLSLLAGGGGGGNALPLPISLDVTWSGLGVTSTATDRNTFKCLAYSTEFTSLYHSSDANASGTISAITGSFNTPLAVVSSSDTHATVKEVPQPACYPL
ncbi:MAG: hypothetical protein M3082_18675 [Candidatus Dormibacteraeota bacterium]|nr:hypothetical protein [Candidatus Dormibacteraeota bacterium]